MAEIHVEPRRGGGLAWLWVLLVVIVIALIVWYFVLGAPGLARPATTPAPATPADTVGLLDPRLLLAGARAALGVA
jgi:hypothetical protein